MTKTKSMTPEELNDKCKDLADTLYEWVRNDGKVYKEKISPLLTNMTEALKKKTYEPEAFVKAFSKIAWACARSLSIQIFEENDRAGNDHRFLLFNRYWIADLAAKDLEKYYKTELELQIKKS